VFSDKLVGLNTTVYVHPNIKFCCMSLMSGALLHFLRRQKHVLKEKTNQLLDMCIQVRYCFCLWMCVIFRRLFSGYQDTTTFDFFQ